MKKQLELTPSQVSLVFDKLEKEEKLQVSLRIL